MSLQRALHFAQLGQRTSMTDALVDAWREHPSQELGDLIRAAPLPKDLAELAEDVAEHQTADGLEDTFRVMRRHLNDPRLTPMILHLAGLPLQHTPTTARHIGELWLANRDPHGSEQMERLGAGSLTAAPLEEPERALLARLSAGVPLLPELAAVYREPDADMPRRVLADLLLERSDDWGSLIALQFGAPDTAQETRLRTLLDARLGETLGPEVAVLELDRGFPAQVRVPTHVKIEPTQAWRTVTQVEFSGMPVWAADRMMIAARVKRLLESEHVQRVHTIWEAPPYALATLDAGAIHVTKVGMLAIVPGAAFQLGQVLERLPTVKQLVGNRVSVEALIELAATNALDSVSVSCKGPGYELEWTAEEAALELEDGRPFDPAWPAVFAARAHRLKRALLRITSSLPDLRLKPLWQHFGQVKFVRDPPSPP